MIFELIWCSIAFIFSLYLTFAPADFVRKHYQKNIPFLLYLVTQFYVMFGIFVIMYSKIGNGDISPYSFEFYFGYSEIVKDIVFHFMNATIFVLWSFYIIGKYIKVISDDVVKEGHAGSIVDPVLINILFGVIISIKNNFFYKFLLSLGSSHY